MRQVITWFWLSQLNSNIPWVLTYVRYKYCTRIMFLLCLALAVGQKIFLCSDPNFAQNTTCDNSVNKRLIYLILLQRIYLLDQNIMWNFKVIAWTDPESWTAPFLSDFLSRRTEKLHHAEKIQILCIFQCFLIEKGILRIFSGI